MGVELAGGHLLAQPRARGGIDDQAGAIPILGRGRSRDQLEGLNGIEGKLVREDFGLLIGYGLVVNYDLRVGVLAQGVIEAVGVGSNRGRGVRDQFGEPG